MVKCKVSYSKHGLGADSSFEITPQGTVRDNVRRFHEDLLWECKREVFRWFYRAKWKLFNS